MLLSHEIFGQKLTQLFKEGQMRVIIRVIFLGCLLFFNASLAVSSGQNLGEKSVNTRMFSYFVSASSIRGSVLHVDNGMAVVITKIKNKCILATVKHLVQDASSVSVMSLGNDLANPEIINADVIYMDESKDVAFLSITTDSSFVTPRVVLDENMLIEKSVSTLKYSPNKGYQTARGRITGFLKLSTSNREFMIAEMSIEEGFSGGGVFDKDGNLVGMVSGRTDYNGVNLACLISGPRIVEALIKSKII
jgi:S1-C subfamily serine protease